MRTWAQDKGISMLWLFRKLCYLRDMMGNAGDKANLIMIIVACVIWLAILVMQILKFLN